jgi:hypothetical protein
VLVDTSTDLGRDVNATIKELGGSKPTIIQDRPATVSAIPTDRLERRLSALEDPYELVVFTHAQAPLAHRVPLVSEIWICGKHGFCGFGGIPAWASKPQREAAREVVSAISAVPQTAAPAPKRTRDLRAYDVLGPFDVTRAMTWHQSGNTERIRSTIREFLWTHFHAHRLGTMTVRLQNMMGDDFVFSDFVEPEASGAWRIHVEYEGRYYHGRGRPPAGSIDPVHIERSEYVIYQLERVWPYGSRLSEQPLPENAQYPGSAHELRYLDWEGRVLWRDVF